MNNIFDSFRQIEQELNSMRSWLFGDRDFFNPLYRFEYHPRLLSTKSDKEKSENYLDYLLERKKEIDHQIETYRSPEFAELVRQKQDLEKRIKEAQEAKALVDKQVCKQSCCDKEKCKDKDKCTDKTKCIKKCKPYPCDEEKESTAVAIADEKFDAEVISKRIKRYDKSAYDAIEEYQEVVDAELTPHVALMAKIYFILSPFINANTLIDYFRKTFTQDEVDSFEYILQAFSRSDSRRIDADALSVTVSKNLDGIVSTINSNYADGKWSTVNNIKFCYGDAEIAVTLNSEQPEDVILHIGNGGENTYAIAITDQTKVKTVLKNILLDYSGLKS